MQNLRIQGVHLGAKMAETPATPKPPEALEDLKEELTAVPPDAILAETVQKVNVRHHAGNKPC